MRKILPGAALILGAVVLTSAMASDFSAEKFYRARCVGCHGIDGDRVPPGGMDVIKGQSADALAAKLKGYQDGSYGGPGKRIMAAQARNLTPEQIEDLAKYMAGF